MGVEHKMVEKISMKTRKKDMLEAYEKLAEQFEQIEEKKHEQSETKQKTTEKIKKQPDAESYTVESIVKDLADLKLNLNKTLTTISDRLLSEVNKLEAVQKEIAVEKKNLSQIHQIQVQADSLKELMQQHTEEKNKMQQEIDTIRKQWQREQEQHEQQVKERNEQLRKQRAREEEEYQYTISKKRKREKEAFEEEKTQLQRQLAEEKEQRLKDVKQREQLVKAQEDELAELRKQVKNFPEELAKTVEKVKQETKDQIEKDLKQKQEFLPVVTRIIRSLLNQPNEGWTLQSLSKKVCPSCF